MNNNTNLTTSVQGTVSAQNSGSNSGTASNSKKSKSQAFTADFKISRDLLNEVQKAELIIINEYYKRNKGLNECLVQQHSFKDNLKRSLFSALAVYDENADGDEIPPVNEEAPEGVILAAAAYHLEDMVKTKGDAMYSNTFGKNICKNDSVFSEDKKDMVRFRLRVGNVKNTYIEILRGLYPKIRTDTGIVKQAFSDVIMFAARLKGNFNTHLSSPGSKMKAMKRFHFELIKFIDEKKKVLVDVFARTASIAFKAMGYLTKYTAGI